MSFDRQMVDKDIIKIIADHDNISKWSDKNGLIQNKRECTVLEGGLPS